MAYNAYRMVRKLTKVKNHHRCKEDVLPTCHTYPPTIGHRTITNRTKRDYTSRRYIRERSRTGSTSTALPLTKVPNPDRTDP